MKNNFCWLMLLSLLPGWGYGQTPTPAPPATASTAAQASDLKTVLSQMDEAAKTFKSAQADVELVQYTKLVDETSTQTGQVFFRSRGKNMDVALRIVTPHPKQVVISGDNLLYYDPKTGQTADRKIGDNRADVETMMNLGFGGRGQELVRDFDVRLIGWETVDGVNTAKLDLIPKGDHFKQYFTKITLWIDPKRDVPLKQQRFESSGDYQLTHYSNIQAPGKFPDDVFKLKKARGTD
jgi:outer membrane lipoprotein-sorting protein